MDNFVNEWNGNDLWSICFSVTLVCPLNPVRKSRRSPFVNQRGSLCLWDEKITLQFFFIYLYSAFRGFDSFLGYYTGMNDYFNYTPTLVSPSANQASHPLLRNPNTVTVLCVIACRSRIYCLWPVGWPGPRFPVRWPILHGAIHQAGNPADWEPQPTGSMRKRHFWSSPNPSSSQNKQQSRDLASSRNLVISYWPLDRTICLKITRPWSRSRDHW